MKPYVVQYLIIYNYFLHNLILYNLLNNYSRGHILFRIDQGVFLVYRIDYLYYLFRCINKFLKTFLLQVERLYQMRIHLIRLLTIRYYQFAVQG